MRLLPLLTLLVLGLAAGALAVAASLGDSTGASPGSRAAPAPGGSSGPSAGAAAAATDDAPLAASGASTVEAPATTAVDAPPGDEPSTATADEPPTALEAPVVAPAAPAFPAVRWRRSRALGTHTAGLLLRGVQLPAEGEHHVTWDPILHRSPNRGWRRWGTDRLLRVLFAVAARYRAAHPGAPRLVIGDLSRPNGGEFGSRFGGLGHMSHQNGLDVDIYYPRKDGRLRPPRTVAQIDRRLAQHLVKLWVAAGAEYVFIGLDTPLTGWRARVQRITHHNDHMHVRLRPRG